MNAQLNIFIYRSNFALTCAFLHSVLQVRWLVSRCPLSWLLWLGARHLLRALKWGASWAGREPISVHPAAIMKKAGPGGRGGASEQTTFRGRRDLCPHLPSFVLTCSSFAPALPQQRESTHQRWQHAKRQEKRIKMAPCEWKS